MLVGLVERSLAFDHALKLQAGLSFVLVNRFWVLVHTAHALLSHVQDETNDLGSLRENSASLNYIFMIEFVRCRILVQLELALNVSEVIILVLQEPGNHLGQMLLILFVLGSNFVGSAHVALLLHDSGGVIERPSCDEALLASGSLYVQDETICRKLLATSDSNYMSRFCFRPSNR